MGTQIATPEGRLLYPSVWKPRTSTNFPEQGPRFECTLFFADGTDLTALKQLATTVMRETFGDNIPQNYNNPFKPHEPDEFIHEKGTTLRMWSKTAPKVVDVNNQPLEEFSPEEIYGGCYGKMIGDCWGYKKGAGGIGFGLLAVQKTRDGERFDGRQDADLDLFGGGGPATPESIL